MKKTFLYLLFLFLIPITFGQNNLDCYRILFLDKDSNAYSINEPNRFLSQRAIDKRSRFNILITIQDFPLNQTYIEDILSLNNEIKLLTKSKWNNSMVIYCPDSSFIDTISNFSYIASIQPIANYNGLFPHRMSEDYLLEATPQINIFDYGLSYEQIAIHQGEELHNLNFMGEGMLIAVLDAGWTGFTSLEHLTYLFDRGQIVGTRDLQPEFDNVYEGHPHGTAVTSIMAAEIDGELIGSAPKANYYFIRSENPWSEQWIEEDFWAEAAEIADSIGADVINSSLGYTTFSNLPTPLTYADCDGESSIASRAASIAAQKGIIVSISAGNSGDSPWHFVARPADAKDILAVGAVNKDTIPAPFTSAGPSYDERIKPDVASIGWFTAHLAQDDSVYLGHGTSYASPVIAGLAACLWQALPQYDALEIMQIIREASHQFHAPDTLMGYGIPNFYKAYIENLPNSIKNKKESMECLLYPNPTNDKTYLYINPTIQQLKLQCVDILGKNISIEKKYITSSMIEINLNHLPQGVYFLTLTAQDENHHYHKISKKIIKQ